MSIQVGVLARGSPADPLLQRTGVVVRLEDFLRGEDKKRRRKIPAPGGSLARCGLARVKNWFVILSETACCLAKDLGEPREASLATQ
jgi:hypothetical protein